VHLCYGARLVPGREGEQVRLCARQNFLSKRRRKHFVNSFYSFKTTFSLEILIVRPQIEIAEKLSGDISLLEFHTTPPNTTLE
jgi:hypothetical protein